jgi:Adenosylmethionine-8-amino-7-oxononanoate aminotransferase
VFPDAVNIGERIHVRAQAKGLLVRPIMHLNVMSPPLIITHAQVDEIVDTLRSCILEAAQELTEQGLYHGQ